MNILNMKSENVGKPGNSLKNRVLLYDLFEDDNKYLVMIDCPGIKKDEISLRVLYDRLNVKINNDDMELDDLDTLYRSRLYEKELTIKFPEKVQSTSDSIKAVLNDGVLSISVEKEQDDDEEGCLIKIA